MPPAQFKVFIGLIDRLATDDVGRLIEVGIVISCSPRSSTPKVGLPARVAGLNFPNLHFQMPRAGIYSSFLSSKPLFSCPAK